MRGSGAIVQSSRFGLISEIDPAEPDSWRDRIFLTLDIDWAPDAILTEVIELTDSCQVPVTWMVTHDTPILERLRHSPKYELGLHPNFNKLLYDRDTSNGATAAEVIERVRAFAPRATAVRSHSMTQATPLLNLFYSMGLTHDANTFIPAQSGIELMPWVAWNGLIRIPYFWEDDLHPLTETGWDAAPFVHRPGLRVFDFHPIHLFLNTQDADHYVCAKPHVHDFEVITRHRRSGAGPRSFFLDVVEMGQNL